MVVSRLLFSTALALSVLRSRAAVAGSADATVKFSLTEARECLASMDEARQAADLPTLTEAKIFPEDTKTGPFNSFCYTLLNIEPPTNVASEAFPGTPAVFKIDEETSPDCNAAVKDWQGGISSFEENPPVRKETNGYSDLDDKARSFVALYNPSDKIQGHCQVIVCEEKTTTPAEPGQQQIPQVREEARGDEVTEDEEEEEEEANGTEGGAGPDHTQGPSPGQPGAGAEENDGAQGKKSSALVCLTYPNALDKNPLFTEEQWEKIAKALSNSASTVVPSLLALSAVLAGASLL